MPINPDQKVFPFLVDDPLYQAAVARERIVRDLLECVGPEMEERIAESLWRERIGPVIEKRIDDRVQELLAQRVREAVKSLEDVVATVLNTVDDHLTAHRRSQDSADWWKRGDSPPGGGDQEDGPNR